MKVAIVTCYAHPDYVRALTLRRAMAEQPDLETIVLKNHYKGLLRYPEVITKIIWTRVTTRPDVYLLTFRAYEILPIAAVLTWPKKIIYDEFLNPLEWLQEERKEWWAKLVPQRLLKSFYKVLVKRCSIILTDTQIHGDYSQKMLGLPRKKFIGLPVGTEESIFKPKKTIKTKDFSVFYYGSMIPLHGLDIALAAAVKLQDKPIRFIFAGGDSKTITAVTTAQKAGANIEHRTWIPFERLADIARESHLTLGGPFGDTPQASMVVTGKTYQFLACAVPVLIGRTKVEAGFMDRDNCLITPLGSADELAKNILWAHDHPKQLARIAQSGYQLYVKKFSSNALADQVAQILMSIS